MTSDFWRGAEGEVFCRCKQGGSHEVGIFKIKGADEGESAILSFLHWAHFLAGSFPFENNQNKL